MKYKAVLIAAGAMLGLLLCFFINQKQKLIVILICLILAFAAKMLIKSKRGKMAFIVFIFAASAAGYNFIYTAVKVNGIVSLSGKTVNVTGIVIDSTEGDTFSATVKGKIDGKAGLIRARFAGVNVSAGDKVSFDAKIFVFENTPDYPSKDYYFSKGIFVYSTSAQNLKIEKAKGIYKLYGMMRDYRDRITTELCSYAGLENGLFLSGMLCGYSPELPWEIRLSVNRCGIGHLLAVSGIHVSMIALVVEMILHSFCLHRYVTFFFSEAIMLLFYVFSGMRISASRAVLMMTIYLLSKAAIRKYDSAAALSTCIIIMTAAQPYCVGDTSFLLSVLGVFGVSIAAPQVIKAFSVKNRFLKSAAVTICASVCTMPVCAFCFDEISLVSPITNLILTPVCSISLCLCMIFAATGGLHILSFLVKAAGFLCGAVIKICSLISSCGLAYYPVKFKCAALFAVIGLIAVILVYILTASVKQTAFSALTVYSLTAAAVFIMSAASINVCQIRILAKDGGYMCMIIKNNECAVIDSDGSFAYECDDVIMEQGITDISCVMILKNGIAAYTGYIDENMVPDVMIFEDTKSASAEGTQICELESVTSFEIFGAKILYESEKGITITYPGGKIAVSDGVYRDDCDFSVLSLDGVVVIKENGKSEMFKRAAERIRSFK